MFNSLACSTLWHDFNLIFQPFGELMIPISIRLCGRPLTMRSVSIGLAEQGLRSILSRQKVDREIIPGESAMSPLSDVIDTVRTRIARYRGKDVGEQNTKTALIDPVLRALGWDVGDLEAVRQEYKRRPRDKPVDYALLLLRAPCLFVEAKALGQNLDDRRWANQIMGYATVAGVEWVVLTDGEEYRIYNALAHVPMEEKLFRSIKVTDPDAPVEETLTLLSKDGLNGNDLEHLWEAHFVDRQMKSVLEGLFSADVDSSFVRLIKKKLTDLPTRDIRASLRRVHATFDFPVDPSMFFKKPPSRRRTRASPKRSEAAKKAWETRRLSGKGRVNVSLLDIIDAGLLKPPVKLIHSYKGHELEAELLPNGNVSFKGEEYKSPSAAGAYARGSVTGKPMSTDGWRFWQYKDENGNFVELDTARREFLKRKS